jgi:hypothetical protein
LLLSLAGLGVATAPDAVLIKLAGDPVPIAGIVVDGKDYAPVDVLAERLGAKTMIDHDEAGKRLVIYTPGAATAKGFDDGPDTKVPLKMDAPTWQAVTGSHGKIRVHDFIADKDPWTIVNEIEVAPDSILVDGRIPRGRVVLSFYITCQDKDGKTVSRMLVPVPNVSYAGGRYPISVAGYYGGPSLPATVSFRYNSAEEMGG